jgi:hypothetical protein
MDMVHEMYDYILVITGATGTVTKALKNNGIRIRKTLNGFPTKDSYNNNYHTLWKVLQSET